jgi:hypothetical protein
LIASVEKCTEEEEERDDHMGTPTHTHIRGRRSREGSVVLPVFALK